MHSKTDLEASLIYCSARNRKYTIRKLKKPKMKNLRRKGSNRETIESVLEEEKKESKVGKI